MDFFFRSKQEHDKIVEDNLDHSSARPSSPDSAVVSQQPQPEVEPPANSNSMSQSVDGHQLVPHESAPCTPDGAALRKENVEVEDSSLKGSTYVCARVPTGSTDATGSGVELTRDRGSIEAVVADVTDEGDDNLTNNNNVNFVGVSNLHKPLASGSHEPPLPTRNSSPDLGATIHTIATSGMHDLIRSRSGTNTDRSVSIEVGRQYMHQPWHVVHLDLSSVSQMTNLLTDDSVELGSQTCSETCNLTATASLPPSPKSSIARQRSDHQQHRYKYHNYSMLRVRLMLPSSKGSGDVAVLFDAPADFRDLKGHIKQLAQRQGLGGFWNMQIRAYCTRGPLLTDEDDYELLRWVASRAHQPVVSLWAMETANFSPKDWFSGLQLCRPYVENLSMAEFLHSLRRSDFNFAAYLGMDWHFPYSNFQRQFGLSSTLAVLFAEFPSNFHMEKGGCGYVPRALSMHAPLPSSTSPPKHLSTAIRPTINAQTGSIMPWTLYSGIRHVVDSLVTARDPPVPPVKPSSVLLNEACHHHGL